MNGERDAHRGVPRPMPYLQSTVVGVTLGLSEHVRSTVEREREAVAKRLEDLEAQAVRLRAVTEAVEAEVSETTRLLRGIDEMLGHAPQLSIDVMTSELRGQKLR